MPLCFHGGIAQSITDLDVSWSSLWVSDTSQQLKVSINQKELKVGGLKRILVVYR